MRVQDPTSHELEVCACLQSHVNDKVPDRPMTGC